MTLCDTMVSPSCQAMTKPQKSVMLWKVTHYGDCIKRKPEAWQSEFSLLCAW